MKKISSRFGAAVVIVALAAVLSGCTSFKYVGQTFPETPYSVPVPMLVGRAEIPPGTYAIIGRGVLTSRKSLDRYDLEEELADEARSRGADAFCVLGTKVIRVGTFGYEDDSLMLPVSDPDSSSSAFAPDGSPLQVDSFGEETNVDFGKTIDMGQVNYRKEYQTRVLFLKNRAALAEVLQERDARSIKERRTVDLPPEPAAPDAVAKPEKNAVETSAAPASASPEPAKAASETAVTPASSETAAAPEKESSEPGNVNPQATPIGPVNAIPASPETPPVPQK